MNIKLVYPFFIGFIVLLTSCAKKAVQVASQPQEAEKPALRVKLRNPVPTKSNLISQLLLIDGLSAKESGDLEKAVQFFEGAIKLDSLNDAAYYQLGSLFLAQVPENRNEALHLYEKAYNLDQGNQWYGSQFGKLLVDAGKYQDGIDVFKSLVNQYPEDLQYQYELAYSYEKAKQYDSAIKMLNHIQESRGFDPSINYQKHKIYFAQNKMELGINEIEEIVKRDSNYTSYAQYLSKYFFDTGKPDKSLQYAQLVLNNEPNDYVAHSILASLAVKKKNEQMVTKHLQFIIQKSDYALNQKVKAFLPIISSLDQVKEMYPVVLKNAQKLVALYPNDAKVYALMGDLYANNNQKEKAIHAFQKSVQQEGAVYGVWEQLLLLLSSTQDYIDLEKISKQAVIKFSNEFLPHYLNGFANRELRNYSESLRVLLKAKDLSESQPNLKTELTVLIAEAYYLNNQKEKAFQQFENLYKAHSNDLLVLNNYAHYLAKSKNDFLKAEELIKHAISLSPEDSNLFDTFGFVQFQQENYKEAAQLFKRAFELEPANSKIIEHLGDSHAKLGKIDSAVHLWEEALKLRSANSDLLKKKIADKMYYSND